MIFRIGLLMLALSGCSASGPLYAPTVIASEGNASVYLYRPSRSEGYLIVPPVSVDGTELFELANNGYAELTLSPGRHLIETKKDGNPIGPVDAVGSIEIEVEAGREYYIRWSPSMGDMKIIPIANPVIIAQFSGLFIHLSKDDALSELKNCKRIYP